MRRLAPHVAMTLVSVLWVVACNGAPPQSEAEGMLQPGGSYIDDSGLLIGALPGTLEVEVGVSVRIVEKPAEALPSTVTVGGEFLDVSAVSDVYGLDNPFVLAYPVPEFFDTSSMALAVLVEPEDMTDADESAGREWQLLDGVYDPEGGYFVTTIGLLAASGRTVVLVEAPGLSSPQLRAEPVLAPQQTGGDFLVSCSQFDQDVNNLNFTCTSSDENDLEVVLEDAYADYTGLGFVAPYLKRRIDADASSFTTNNFNIVFAEYLAELRPFRSVNDDDDIWPCGQGPNVTNLGGYSASTRTFFVCIGAGGVTTRSAETARHEYFHATQYGYAAVRASNQSWVKESTASASERSMTTMARDPSRGLRVVDDPLTAVNPGTVEYTTQDFFVYAGVRLGRGLDYLIDVFEEGAATGDVDAALVSLGINGGLESLYWSWAKNQAFEARFDLGGGELGAACAFSPGTATPTQVEYGHVAPPSAKTVTMGPLSSAVVRIEFAALADTDYTTQVTVDELNVSGPDDVRVKFYDANDAGTTDCWTASESNQLSVAVAAGQPRTFYALISNLKLSGSAGAEIEFATSGPQIEILSPANGATFSEDDEVEFLAVAAGLGGQNPAATLVTWTYPRFDGVPITFSSASGEAVPRQFCDGSYTILATAIDAITSETVSDSVTITVSNAYPPPPECAPSIDILQPDQGATYALGESVTFEAVIDDDKPGTDEPIYPLTWRDGGPSGLIIAQNTLSFSRDKFGEGTHEIFVEYGTASDSVTIEIVDTSNTAPTANITSPADGAEFSYVELAASPQVQFSGNGSDAEDGTLSGGDLTWEYLREGSDEWVEAGSGGSFTLNVVYGSDNVTTYRVRLTATDSEGLSDEDEVQISILNPPQ